MERSFKFDDQVDERNDWKALKKRNETIIGENNSPHLSDQKTKIKFHRESSTWTIAVDFS